LKAGRLVGVIVVEAVDAVLEKKSLGVWSGNNSEPAIVKVHQVISKESRDANPTPCHPKDNFWNPVKSFDNVPGAAV